MKRLRNVAAATAGVLVFLFLFAQYRSDLILVEPSYFRQSHNDTGKSLKTATIEEPIATPTGLGEEKINPSSSGPQTQHEAPQEQLPPSVAEPSIAEVVPSSSLPPALPPVVQEEFQNDSTQEFPPAMDSDNNTPNPSFEAEFPFQRELDLDLPIETLEEMGAAKPCNYDPDGPKTNAYATFMATRNPSLKDPYFLAIQSLIYRVLWSSRSRTEKYPFVVFVGDFVTAEQRNLLAGAGAIVRELAPLEWNPDTPGVQHRWKDLFAKLNMWNETEFSRIIFLDADAFPTTNIDDMFDIPPRQDCIDSRLEPDDYLLDSTPVCEPYVFAGVPQNPFNETDMNINVGSMVFSPSERMHQRLLQNYVKTDRYDCLMAEQAFLNWQFNPKGAFPATLLERQYGGFFPSEDEEGKLKVVHEKLWSEDREWMKNEWLTQWKEMLTFYASDEFRQTRAQNTFR